MVNTGKHQQWQGEVVATAAYDLDSEPGIRVASSGPASNEEEEPMRQQKIRAMPGRVRSPGVEAVIERSARHDGGNLLEHVLVLRVAGDQAPFPVLVGDHELESAERRVDRDERDRAIVVLP